MDLKNNGDRTKQMESMSSDSEDEELQNNAAAHATMACPLQADVTEEEVLVTEPQLYLCDDWILPTKVMKRPRNMTAKEKRKAKVTTNYLIDYDVFGTWVWLYY